MKNKFLKGVIASFALAVSGFANAGLIVGVSPNSGSGSYDELVWTLDQLGYSVTNDYTLADVVINASGNSTFGDLSYFDTHGIGYIQIGDWGLDATPNSWQYNVGTYTLELDTNHAIGTGISGSWTGFGFHNNNNSWVGGENGYLGWDTNLAHDSLVKSTSLFVHDRVVTAFDLGNYNSVYIGYEAYGQKAHSNTMKLLDNSIQWAATGTVSSVDVPEPSTLAVFALGLMGLASRKFKKQA